MDTKPNSDLCSIICLTYNQANYSESALQSIFDQTHANNEIIVVDDGSTDGNQEIIKSKLKSSPMPCSFIEQENSGNIGLNFNRGIAAARGAYISFLSLDDILLPDCIESKVAILRQDQQVMFVANTVNMVIDEHGSTSDERFHGPLYGKEVLSGFDLLESEFSSIGSFYIQGTVFRREIVDRVGAFDEDMTGDDLILRTKILLDMKENPETTARLLHFPGIKYRLHPDNLHRNTLRQVRTVLEWQWRYFPNRNMSPLCLSWIWGYFDELIREGRSEELRRALEENDQLMASFSDYRRTWRYQKLRIKQILKSILVRS